MRTYLLKNFGCREVDFYNSMIQLLGQVLQGICVALPFYVNISTNRGEDGAVVGAAGQVGQGLETGAVTACHTGLNKRKVFNREKKAK